MMTNATQYFGFFAARHKLRRWGVKLQLERLPNCDYWIVARCPEHYLFQVKYALFDKVKDAENVRVVFEYSEFWKIVSEDITGLDEIDECIRRWTGRLQYYDPYLYLLWARVMVKKKRYLIAGMYFLFSGLYSESERQYLEKFKHSIKQAHPREIVGRMPAPCLRITARLQFPLKVFEDLLELPAPEWLKKCPKID